MSLLTRQISPSTLLPLTVQEAKVHCRIDSTEEDAYIEGLIRAAAGAFERESKRVLMLAPHVTVLNRWSYTTFLAGPIQAIEKVEYLDTDSAVATLSPAAYSVGVISPDALLLSGLGPTLGRSTEPIRVYYTAGYATPAEVPAEIKQWLLFMVGHWYENRTPLLVAVNAQEVPQTAKYLMNLLREPTL